MASQPSENILPTSVKLEAVLKRRLEKIGIAKNRKLHWLLKEAIQQYIVHIKHAREVSFQLTPAIAVT